MTAGRSKKKCTFCIDQVMFVDYKHLKLLRKYLSQYGKIVPRYYTGNCLWHQKRLANAIKRAREAALLPFLK